MTTTVPGKGRFTVQVHARSRLNPTRCRCRPTSTTLGIQDGMAGTGGVIPKESMRSSTNYSGKVISVLRSDAGEIVALAGSVWRSPRRGPQAAAERESVSSPTETRSTTSS